MQFYFYAKYYSELSHKPKQNQSIALNLLKIQNQKIR